MNDQPANDDKTPEPQSRQLTLHEALMSLIDNVATHIISEDIQAMVITTIWKDGVARNASVYANAQIVQLLGGLAMSAREIEDVVLHATAPRLTHEKAVESGELLRPMQTPDNPFGDIEGR